MHFQCESLSRYPKKSFKHTLHNILYRALFSFTLSVCESVCQSLRSKGFDHRLFAADELHSLRVAICWRDFTSVIHSGRVPSLIRPESGSLECYFFYLLNVLATETSWSSPVRFYFYIFLILQMQILQRALLLLPLVHRILAA